MTSSRSAPVAGERTGRAAWLRNRWGLVLLVVALAVVLMVENSAEVQVRLLVPVVRMPMWTAFVLLFLGGVLAGWLAGRRR